jgi:hypothetical protein
MVPDALALAGAAATATVKGEPLTAAPPSVIVREHDAPDAVGVYTHW